MLLATEPTLLATDRHPGSYVAGPVSGLLVDLGRVLAEIVAGVLDVITGIFQMTSELLAGFFTGLGSINESSGAPAATPREKTAQ